MSNFILLEFIFMRDIFEYFFPFVACPKIYEDVAVFPFIIIHDFTVLVPGSFSLYPYSF